MPQFKTKHVVVAECMCTYFGRDVMLAWVPHELDKSD